LKLAVVEIGGEPSVRSVISRVTVKSAEAWHIGLGWVEFVCVTKERFHPKCQYALST